MQNNNLEFSNLSLFHKLSFLEDLLFKQITKKSSKNSDFNVDLKLLLDIIKFKNKINSNNSAINLASLLNENLISNKEKSKNGKKTLT